MLVDDFDLDLDSTVWEGFEGTAVAKRISEFYGTESSGNVLVLNGSGRRSATTVVMDTTQPGEVSFLFVYTPHDTERPAYPDKEVSLEYSLDGVNFVPMGGPYDNVKWRRIIEPIPQEAQSPHTQFRFVQTDHDGLHRNTWAIEDLAISPTTVSPVIFSPLTAGTVAGRTFEYEFRASGRVLSTEVDGLPEGLSYDPASRFITGSAITAGTYPLALSATNSFGTTTETLELTVIDSGLQVALFSNGTRTEPEAIDVRAMLERLGYVVTLFRGWAPEDWSTAFASSDLVVYPDLYRIPESGPDPQGIATAINAGMSAGTPLIVIGGNNGFGSDIFRSYFEISDVSMFRPSYIDEGPIAKRAGVSGFSNSPPTLSQNGIYQYRVGDLPAGVTRIYDNLNWAEFDIFYSPVFHVGRLGFIGYDWRAGPASDWEAVLQDMILHLRPPPTRRPIINSPLTARASAGANFRYELRALLGPSSFGVGGLPAGLTINPDNGLIHGIAPAAGTYPITVWASNDRGTESETLTLTVVQPPAGEGLRIVDLDPAALATVDATPLIDTWDRETIAVSAQQVFLSTVEATAGFAADLSGGTQADLKLLEYCSDLATGSIYTLAYNGTPVPRGGYPWESDKVVNQLIEIDPVTGDLIGSVITLPISIRIYGGESGLFSGNGRVILHNGREAFDIFLRDGSVTRLGRMTKPHYRYFGGLAIQGVVESFAGNLYLVYRSVDGTAIDRFRIPDGQTESIALSTSASVWTISPANNHWYYNDSRNLVMAPATIELGDPAIPPVITSAAAAEVLSSRAFRYRITASPSPETFSAIGLPSGLTLNAATGLITGTEDVPGEYSVTLSAINARGTSSQVFVLTVLESPTSLYDDFDPDAEPDLWIGSMEVSSIPGERAGRESRGNSLYFGGTVGRSATTRSIDLRSGGHVSFIYAGGTTPSSATGWQGPGTNDGIVLEYSLDGSEFTQFGGPYPHVAEWTVVREPIPAAAQSPSTQIRVRSLKHGGAGLYNWGIDDFQVGTPTELPVLTNSPRFRMISGEPVEIQLTAVPGVTRYEAVGLPPGLSLDAQTGLMTGTPTVPGGYLVTMIATNGAGSSSSDHLFSVPDRAGVIAVNRSFHTTNAIAMNHVAALEREGIVAIVSPNLLSEGVDLGGLLFPSMNRTVAMTDQIRTVLEEALASGKPLVVTGYSTVGTRFLNDLVGWSLVGGERLGSGTALVKSVELPNFLDFPDVLPSTGTNTITTASLPPGALALYQSGDYTGVFVDGLIAYFGNNWAESGFSWDTVLGDLISELMADDLMPPVLLGPFLADMYTGQEVRIRIRAAGADSNVDVSGLPDGLVFDAVSSSIVGRVPIAGLYRIDLSATNANGTKQAPMLLVVEQTQPLLEDDFDPGLDEEVWAELIPSGDVEANTVAEASGPGSMGNSLWFGGYGDRHAATIPTDTRNVDEISFLIATGNTGSDPWESPGTHYPVYIDYKVDLDQWIQLGGPFSNERWTTVALPLPPEAKTQATEFRFRQSQLSSNKDNWAIEDFRTGPPLNPPVITSPLVAHSFTAVDFSYHFTTTGISSVVNVSDLPPGLHFDSFTNEIRGTIQTAGVYPIRLSVTDTNGQDFQILELTVEDALPSFFDDFDPGIDSGVWLRLGRGLVANTIGQRAGQESTGNSLYFGYVEDRDRFALTRQIDARPPGLVSFLLASGDASYPWELPGPGNDVVLEYSIDGGTTFEIMGGPYTQAAGWQDVSEPIPTDYPATLFRLRQLNALNSRSDHWAIDDVRIGPHSPPPGNRPPEMTGGEIRIHTGLFSGRIGFEEILELARDFDGHPFVIRRIDEISQHGFTLHRRDDDILYALPDDFEGIDSIGIVLTDGYVDAPVSVRVNVASLSAAKRESGPRVVREADGSLTAYFEGIPGWRYGLQRSTSLLWWQWTDVGSATADDSGLVTFSDPNPPDPRAYYRVVFPAPSP